MNKSYSGVEMKNINECLCLYSLYFYRVGSLSFLAKEFLGENIVFYLIKICLASQDILASFDSPTPRSLVAA